MTTDKTYPAPRWKRWIPTPPVLIAWGVLLGILGWTYGTTLVSLVQIWWRMPDYQHGFFVPMFAAFLLWWRQDMVEPWPTKGTWLALPVFVVWGLMRWLNLALHYERDVDSLFPLLVGLALFLGSWRALHWAWPSIAFLIFMVPLPGSLAVTFSQHLQYIATQATAFTLQTLGIAAIERGNTIQLSNPANVLEVEQACSGLRMLTLFFAMCVGAVFVLRVRWWEKLIILVSAVPIALICNVARITLDGVLTELVGSNVGHWVHDNFGWFMMILGLLMIWGEMTLISQLFVEVPAEGPLSLGDAGAPGG